ncbi:MAG: hypothetical protein Q8L81_12660 [Bacteroidota bacterium]|nr:hypothetical protein [Bacteroidota bacterium]
MERTEILNRIIEKGGLMAACGIIYINDEKKAHGFLMECFEQCQDHSFVEYWGKELVLDIIKYGQSNENGNNEAIKTAK